MRRGFTMIELMVVLALVAILAVLAAPSFTDQFARRQLEGIATDMSTDLQFARTQAVAERGTTTLVSTTSGYTVTTAQGSKAVAFPNGIANTLATTVTYDQFRGTADAAKSFILSNSARTTAQIQVDVNIMGRVSLCSPSGTLKGYTAC